jgi:hypothetical protein
MRAAIASVALLAGSASAGSPDRPEQPERPEQGDPGAPIDPGTGPRHAADCAAAAIADIELAQPEPVDEIQVFVRDGSSTLGAAEVTVASGRPETFDRVLRVRGASHGLMFYPALTSSSFRVSLLPALEAPGLVCVDRIELRRAGHAVATITP